MQSRGHTGQINGIQHRRFNSRFYDLTTDFRSYFKIQDMEKKSFKKYSKNIK